MIPALLLVLLSTIPGLPSTARVIEARQLPPAAHPNRLIVLWMDSPTVSPCWLEEDEPYTPSCPALTRGCSFAGATRISLFDTKTHRIMNTITVLNPDSGKDSLEIPYLVRKGGPYFVPGRKKY